MHACAEPRAEDEGTWITTEMRAAYARLAALGYAHSIEAWQDDALVGGLYGVAIGRVFFGESMFARVSDASKVALATLVRQLQRWEFRIIDCQMPTAHLASLGAREIPRREFLAEVERAVCEPSIPTPWMLEALGKIDPA
jgi:leucyl/phenylalanyl-tRNA--protein transferase